MKKILFFASALAGLFLAASCQQENLEPVGGNTVTYTVQVPEAISTKALIGEDVAAVTQLIYEVYRTEAETADDHSKAELRLYQKEATLTDGEAKVELELVNNQNFRVLFWAQVPNNGVYTTTDLKNVTLLQDLAANAENYNAFAGADYIKYGDNLAGRTITLVRPIAQLNIATTPESLVLGEGGTGQTTVAVKTSEVIVDGLSTTYNVSEAKAGADAVKFEYSATDPDALTQQTLTVNGKDYQYLSMNYVGFAAAAGSNVTVDYDIVTENVGTVSNIINNVPVKANYRTNIVGNLITSMSDYTVTLDKEWAGVAEEVEIITDGLVLVHSTGVYNISNANGLAYASQNLFAKNGGTYVLTEDIDMTGASSVVTKAAEGLAYNSAALTYKMTAGSSFEFDGAGHTIKNLPGMFIAYTGSAKSVVVKNLTLETPNVAYDVDDVPETNGVGAFIGYAGTSTTITLDNCHVKGGRIEGGHWTGGLVGYAAGYSGNDGPVFETLTIKNCSVRNATVTGKGSVGGIIGHATGDDWTLVDMDKITVAFNNIISTGSSDNKAGSVMGTLGNAGQPKTVNGVTKIGGVTIDNYEVLNNVVKSNNVDNTKLWGRQGNSNGVLTINGEKVTDFNADVPTTNNTITVSNDAELAQAISAVTGDWTIILAEGTYSNDINLTVAEYGGAKGDLVFKAVEGAEPVIAGTVTLGLYEKQTTNVAKWNGNVTFEGITFDHAEAANHSFSVQNVGTDDESVALTLKNCKIIGDGEYGIGANSGCIAYNSRIIGCTFENAAMQITGNFGTGLVIDGCTFNESRINVQGGNGVTVQNCNFTNTLTSANVGDSFYLIRSNAIPITVKGCNINIDSELTDVAAGQAKWGVFWNRGTTNWTVENVAVTMTEAAMKQTELEVTKCTSTGVINSTNMTVNGKTYASTAASLTSAVNSGATDIYVEGNFKMPSSSTSNAIKITSLNGNATIDNTLGSYWDGATLTFNNVNFKTSTGYANGNGSDYAALYSKNVTYNKCNFSGPMRLGRDGAKFIDCTFNDLGNDYVWTYGNAASFTGCTFNSAGKALLIYSDGGNGAPAVSVTGCTFNATTGAKAGAISNQNCAAIEIHNHGYGVTLTTADNTVDTADGKFSGEWRIKTYETGNADSKIFVNGTEYTTLALDGRTMTIDGTVVTVQ